MSLTGEQLLEGFSKFISDWEESATTSAGNAGGTTLIDTALRKRDDEGWRDYYFRITETGDTSIREVRRASSFVNSSATVTVAPAYSAQIGSAVDYQAHKYEPRLKFAALDSARFDAVDDLFKIVRDDTITADGLTNEYPIPSSVRHGPFSVVVERPLEVDVEWNVLSNPAGTTTDDWTAANGITATTVSRGFVDRYVPKHEEAATKLVYADGGSDGTFTQTVSVMEGDADDAAGRDMVFGAWVYSEVTTNGPLLEIIDDSGTQAASSSHTGTGWEFLTCSDVIAQTNATTLSVRLRIPTTGSNDQVAYIERRWFSFGAALPNVYHEDEAVQVMRDDTLQRFRLPFIPPRGHQLRCIGRDILSALGDDVDSQASNTMEVDTTSAELLYTYAAERLFGGEYLNSPAPQTIVDRINLVRSRFTRTKRGQHEPASRPRVVGPYGR